MIILVLSSFEFLNSGLSAFSLNKGNAITGLKEESFQLFINPSGTGGDLCFSYYRFLGKIDIISLSKGLDIHRIKTGLGFIFVNSGKMVERDTLGDSIGVFYDVSFIAYLGIRRNINKFFFGLSFFFPYEKVLEYSSYGAGVNVGMIYSINDRLNAGFTLRNLGYIFNPFIDYKYRIKEELRFGFSYRDKEKYLGIDFMYPFSFAVGLNYPLNDNVIFGIGFNRNPDLNSGEGGDILNGFIFGLKIKKGFGCITYNASISGIFGINHSFGIRF